MSKISDVARIAGVSPATVSRVFNRPDLVTPDKRERVFAAVRELDYAPSQTARNLRAGAVRTITVLVGDISQPFHGALGKALGRIGDAKGYRVVLYDLDHSEERLVRVLNDLRTSDTYGVVLATANDLGTEAVLDAVSAAQARGIFVVSSSQQRSDTLPAIIPRYQAISHLASLHLATQGCDCMVFLGGQEESPLSRERRSGFERACRELGYSEQSMFILDGAFEVEAARIAFDTLIRQTWGASGQPVPSIGVVSVNMRMTIGAMHAASDNGLVVPEQVSVVCCEDIPTALEWRPAVTTVGVDFNILAEMTLDVLLMGADAPPVTHLPHRLIVRASSERRPPGAGAPSP